jgi:pimeloyl-ACP methyl ester carboxylesterase
VLLVHGFGAAAIQWLPLARALRPHVRAVWAIDLPGHGFSGRPERLTLDTLKVGVLEGLDQVHPAIGPALIVGNSLGGAVALRYANERADLAIGAHLLSPGGAPMAEAELEAVRRIFRVVGHRQAVEFLHALYGDPQGLRAHAFAPFVRRVFRDPALHGLLEQVTDADWLTPDEVRGAPRPLRIVWGRRDKILPQTAVSFWRTHLPAHGELHEPETFGHVPHLSEPGPTARDILAFARKITGAATAG